MKLKNCYIAIFSALLLSSCGGEQSTIEQDTQSTESEIKTQSNASAGEKLIEATDCRGCHNKDTKIIGPSYIEIAKKYENNAQNVSMLSKKIIEGGKGNWGEILMSAHPQTSETDAKEMVKYILSLKP